MVFRMCVLLFIMIMGLGKMLKMMLCVMGGVMKSFLCFCIISMVSEVRLKVKGVGLLLKMWNLKKMKVKLVIYGRSMVVINLRSC